MASSRRSCPRPQPGLLCPQHSPCYVPTSQAALTVPRCTCHLHAPAPTSSHRPLTQVSWSITGCSREWVHGRRNQPVFISGDVCQRDRERENACTRNVYTALMQGAVYAENSTPASWLRTLLIRAGTHSNIAPRSKHAEAHTEIVTFAQFLPDGTALAVTTCLCVCAFVCM